MDVSQWPPLPVQPLLLCSADDESFTTRRSWTGWDMMGCILYPRCLCHWIGFVGENRDRKPWFIFTIKLIGLSGENVPIIQFYDYDSHGYAAWCLQKVNSNMPHDLFIQKKCAFSNVFCFSMCCWCPGGPGRIPSTRINSKLDLTTVGMFDIYIYIFDIMTEKRIPTIMIYQIMISFRDNIYVYIYDKSDIVSRIL